MEDIHYMLRTPTRTKTGSFNGSQGKFKFPTNVTDLTMMGEEFQLEKQSNGCQFLEAQLTKKSQEDLQSQILSDYTATGSNSGNSSNGYYSFANISDNTTNRDVDQSKAQNLNVTLNNSRTLYVSSSSSSTHYPTTLAPDRSPRICAFSSSPNNRLGTCSSTMRSIPENASALPFLSTVPTADNVSFEISLLSDRPTSIKIKKSSNLKRGNSGVRRISSIQSSISDKARHSKLKRSNAIRCKGGLLAYFNRFGIKIERTLRRIEMAVKRKLFSYKQRTLTKKKSKKTTSHLLRSNGYFANIKRSKSMRSLANHTDHETERVGSNFEVNNNMVTTFPSLNQRSLRRSPSSIKRAVSVLTNNNASSMSRNVSLSLRSPSGRLVRSQPSLNLNSTIRQPSIVVDNKVIPLSNFDHEDYCITEEDDEDEYVIDTHQMQPLKSDSNSIVSSFLNESQYEDAEDHNSSMESLTESIKIRNARTAWDGYLRAVISQRILLRLQIAKFQESQSSDDHKHLIDAILNGYYNDQFYSDDEEHIEDDLPLRKSSNLERYPTSKSHIFNFSRAPSTDTVLKPSGDSFTRLMSIQHSVRQGVRRNLTLPVGIKV